MRMNVFNDTVLPNLSSYINDASPTTTRLDFLKEHATILGDAFWDDPHPRGLISVQFL